ncbi:exported hypothetical protein [Gammaproteobacteria bacterium]
MCMNRTFLSMFIATSLAGAAAWTRHGFIESETLAPLCLEAVAPWWCAVRATLEAVEQSPLLAVVALAISMAALRRQRHAGLGIGLGGIALAFGNLGCGGPAVVIGVLALVRQQPR